LALRGISSNAAINTILNARGDSTGTDATSRSAAGLVNAELIRYITRERNFELTVTVEETESQIEAHYIHAKKKKGH
jgi:hypothetical protein